MKPSYGLRELRAALLPGGVINKETGANGGSAQNWKQRYRIQGWNALAMGASGTIKAAMKFLTALGERWLHYAGAPR
ncbi:hypothetical protein KCP77_09065 [Salmonella enterica subsp. enterica]|nr:hypothetical protein KCP77_09065 [Salmonella enterica subsp. enterica]